MVFVFVFGRLLSLMSQMFVPMALYCDLGTLSGKGGGGGIAAASQHHQFNVLSW